MIRKSEHDESPSLELLLEAIDSYEILDPDEEYHTVARAQKGDQKAKEKLLLANLRFILKVSKEYQGLGLSLGDLIDQGVIGFYECLKTYDLKHNKRLVGYADQSIRNSIRQALPDYVSVVVPKPNHVRDSLTLKRERDQFEQEEGRYVSHEELRDRLGWTDNRYDHANRLLDGDNSLHANGETLGPEDYLASDINSPDSMIEMEQDVDLIRRAVANMDIGKSIIATHLYDSDGEPNMAAVGRQMGVTREAIRQKMPAVDGQLLERINRYDPVRM